MSEISEISVTAGKGAITGNGGTAGSGMRLELDCAGYTYQAGTHFAVQALDPVSLKIEPGERVAIAGPVGSGKSTLLQMLAGVQEPTTGKVFHDGREITHRNQPRVGSIGLAFQSPENCLFEKTVFDDVAFGPRRLGLDSPEIKRRVEEALAATGLDPTAFGSRSPFSLSTGEQRRVALAGVLAMEPRALLLDEPTAHLDPATRRDLIDRLVRLNNDTGVMLVIVGHDMDELARFSGRLVVIDSGRKVADGPAAEILTDPARLAGYGLDSPGTVQVCELLAEAMGRPLDPVLDESRLVEMLAGIMDERAAR